MPKLEARSRLLIRSGWFPKQKLTKGAVADYYQRMARWILPEISARPLSLLRCPDGVGKACFFQKHHGAGLGDAVHAVPLQQKSGREDYVYIDDARGLLQLVQMNTLELHPWCNRRRPRASGSAGVRS